MDLTLVPFGYQVSQRLLVDVYKVPSGKKCGCICPSCRAPLVARKGNKKIWHFAHDSKGEVLNKLKKCNFSFYVSARMMARQLIGDCLSINLPMLEVTQSQTSPISGIDITVATTVADPRIINLESVSIDTKVGETHIDFSGFIDSYCLAFIFTHPGRDEFSHLADLEEKKTGIVGISLPGLQARFHDQKESNRSYSDILADFITQDILSKKWLYHPKLRETEQQVKLDLEGKLAKAEGLLKQAERPLTAMRFDCRLCKSSWTDRSISNASCKNCGASPLLVARTEIPDHKN